MSAVATPPVAWVAPSAVPPPQPPAQRPAPPPPQSGCAWHRGQGRGLCGGCQDAGDARQGWEQAAWAEGVAWTRECIRKRDRLQASERSIGGRNGLALGPLPSPSSRPTLSRRGPQTTRGPHEPGLPVPQQGERGGIAHRRTARGRHTETTRRASKVREPMAPLSLPAPPPTPRARLSPPSPLQHAPHEGLDRIPTATPPPPRRTPPARARCPQPSAPTRRTPPSLSSPHASLSAPRSARPRPS